MSQGPNIYGWNCHQVGTFGLDCPQGLNVKVLLKAPMRTGGLIYQPWSYLQGELSVTMVQVPTLFAHFFARRMSVTRAGLWLLILIYIKLTRRLLLRLHTLHVLYSSLPIHNVGKHSLQRTASYQGRRRKSLCSDIFL
jgi:hypothetical protein